MCDMTPEEVYKHKSEYAALREEIEENQNDWIDLAFSPLGNSRLMEELKKLAKESMKTKLTKLTNALSEFEVALQNMKWRQENENKNDRDLPF